MVVEYRGDCHQGMRANTRALFVIACNLENSSHVAVVLFSRPVQITLAPKVFTLAPKVPELSQNMDKQVDTWVRIQCRPLITQTTFSLAPEWTTRSLSCMPDEKH